MKKMINKFCKKNNLIINDVKTINWQKRYYVNDYIDWCCYCDWLDRYIIIKNKKCEVYVRAVLFSKFSNFNK
jgi:hypothetical protein